VPIEKRVATAVATRFFVSPVFERASVDPLNWQAISLLHLLASLVPEIRFMFTKHETRMAEQGEGKTQVVTGRGCLRFVTIKLTRPLILSEPAPKSNPHRWLATFFD